MASTIIIAEVGECFCGNLETARELIGVARKAGCDIVKFQTLDDQAISPDDPECEWFYRVALNPEKIEMLKGYAGEAGIGILFTPENVRTAQWLVDAGQKDVKIASSSTKDPELISYIKENFDRVFISTGMASLDEVNTAVRLLENVPELYIMHCISEYPTGPLLEARGLCALGHADVRMNMMHMLMQLFPQHKIGYSDHTVGLLAPVVAVAMGAKVIEKHITMDRTRPMQNLLNGGEYLGTDHVLSLEPDELAEMVAHVREAEKIMGEYKWERTPGEIILRDFMRGRFS